MQDGEQLTNNTQSPEPDVIGSEASIPAPVKQAKSHLGLWSIGVVLVVLGISSLIFFGLRNKSKDNQTSTTTIKPQQVDTSKLSPATEAFTVSSDKVVINGQLQADSALVLTPISQPDTAVTGLVYLDSESKELRYYNGTEYVSLVSQTTGTGGAASQAGVTSLQGSTGALTLLGTGGLTITSGGSTITMKLPQNLTTTASPTFAGLTLNSPLSVASGGTGVASFTANGVVITNGVGGLSSLTTGTPNLCLLSTAGAPVFGSCVSGAVGSLNGFTGTLTIDSTNLVVTDNGSDTIHINAPQAIDTTDTPTFAGVNTNSINPSAALTVGDIVQAFTLQGSSASAITATSGGFTTTISFTAPTANTTLTVPNEAGKFCTSDLSVPVNDDCYSKFASASGSSAGYIQFAPAQVQEDHTCDGVDPCATSTIYVGKTATTGNIVRIQGWCLDPTDVTCSSLGELQDAFVIQGNGDTYFRSLQQSATAFSIRGYSGESILNVSTVGPTPAFLCTVDFENPQPPGFGDCADNDYTKYLPFDQNPANTSPATTTALDGAIFHGGSQSLKITYGTRTAVVADVHGVYLPYTLNYGQTYQVSFYIYHPPTGYVTGMHVNYFRGSTPYGVGFEAAAPAQCTNRNIPKNSWTRYSCTFTIKAATNGAQTNADGIIFRIFNNCQCANPANPYLDGAVWYLDDIDVIKGGSVANQTTLNAPFLVNPQDNDVAFVISEDSGGNLLVANTTKRQITISREDNTDTPLNVPALYVTNNNGSAANFQLAANNTTATAPTVTMQLATGQTSKLLSLQSASGAELSGFNSSGQLVFHPSAGSTFTGTLKVANLPTASRTYTLPDASGTICITGLACAGSGGSLQDAYTNSTGGTTPEIAIDSTRGAIDIQDANPTAGTNLLNLWASGVDISTGDPLLSVGNTGQVTLQNSVDGAAAFQVLNAIGSTALSVDTSTLNVDIPVSLSTPLITSSGAFSLTPGGAATIGDTGQTLTLQGNATTTLSATDSGFTSTLAFATPTANHTYNLPDLGVGASDEICLLTLSNCSNANSVTSSGGTTNYIPLFTGSNNIEDSLLSDDGTTLFYQGLELAVGNPGADSGVVSLYNSSNSNIVSLRSGVTSVPGLIFTLPTADGSPNQCLQTDGSGGLSFANCVGGSGGSSGVSSLNTLTGALTIAGTTNQITVTPSGGNTLTLSTPQDIHSGASPTFAAVNTNTITPSGALTLGSVSQAFTLQGTSASVITGKNGSFTTTLGFTTPTANNSILLPDAGGTICTTVNISTCVSGAGGAGVTLQSAYTNSTGSTTPEIKLDSTRGALDIQDANSTISANLLNVWASNINISSGDPLFSVGNTGTTTFRNSSDSTTALQIKRSNGDSLLTADTSSVALLSYSSFKDPGTGVGLQVTNQSNTQILDVYDAGNLLTNSSFESGSTGWTLGGSATVSNSLGAYDGSNAAGLFNGNQAGTMTQSFTFAPRTTYTLSYQTTGNGGTTLSSTYTDSTGSHACSSSVGTQWTQASCTFTTTTGGSGNISFTLATGAVSVAVVDAVQLEIAGSPTAFSSSTTGGATVVSGAAFQVQNAAGSTNFINVDTTGSSVTLQGAVGTSYNIGTTTGTGTITVGQSTASNTINIGNAATATGNTQTINIGATSGAGTGKAVITIGETNGASSLTLQAGTGNVAIQGAVTTTYTVGTTTGTGAITIGQSTASETINIGNAATANGNTTTINIGATSGAGTGKAAITIGETNGASSLTLQAGTGNIAVQGAVTTTYTVGTTTGTGAITIGQSTASETINIGNAATATGNTTTISIGNTTGAGTGKAVIGIGETNGASSLSLQAGTGNIALLTSSHSSILIGNTGSSVITIGNGTSASGAGDLITIQGATGAAASAGGAVTVQGGSAGTTGTGGALTLQGGANGGSNGSSSGGISLVTTAGANGAGVQNGGSAGNISLTTGAGGNGGGSGKNAASGGSITLTLGNGGTNSGGGTQGNGGTFTLQGGDGGVHSGSVTAGAGSSFSFTAGNGGNGTGGSNNGGNGGAITLTAGYGGLSSGGTAGAGGTITLQGGGMYNNCTATSFCGATITAGGGFVAGGTASVTGGTLNQATVGSLSSGSAIISSGSTLTSTGSLSGLLTGNVYVQSGNFTGIGTDNVTTGSVNIFTGSGFNCGLCGVAGNTTSGNINIDVSQGTGSGTTGSINIGAGLAVATSGSAFGDSGLTIGAASAINIGATSMTGSIVFRNSNTSGLIVLNSNSSRIFNIDTSTTQNLVTSGSFELSSVPSIWTARGSSTLSIISSSQIQGNNSLQVATTAAANDGAKYSTGASFLTSSTQYTVSFWAKLSSGSMTTFEYGRADDGSTDTNCATGQSLSTTWAYFTCTFTTGTVSGSPYIYFKQTDASARNIILDAVQLETGATATTFNAGGQVQLLGTVNSPVTIRPKSDSTQVLQVQNSSGTNFLQVDTLNGAVTMGNSSASTTTTIQGGTGASAVSIQSGASGTIKIGTANAANTIQVGNITDAIAQTINIGNNATASSTDTIAIGNLLSTSTTTIQGGTGAGAISIQAGTSGTISIGTVNNLNVVIGKSGGTGTLTVNGNSTFNGNLVVTNGHIKSTQTTAPTIGTPSNCGTSPSAAVTASSTDTAGSFTITAGTAGGYTTCDVTITFNTAYGAAPKSIILQPTTAVGSATGLKPAQVSATSTTTFTVKLTTAPGGDSEVNGFYYIVIE